MLVLKKFIGKGATRICFEHPVCPEKCVKVAVRFRDADKLKAELKTYFYVKSYLGEYVPNYDNPLADTNLGKGLVCELLRDDDGSYSRTLADYWVKNKISADLVSQLRFLGYHLIAHDLFFYDFNLQNFVVQIKNGRQYLKYTDLKSFNNYKSWTFLKLERIIVPLARYLMTRRLKRLISTVEARLLPSGS